MHVISCMLSAKIQARVKKNKRGKIQIQEAEITYIAVAALDEIEIKKDVEGNVVYNVITFV